jgi:hypothetical protein
MELYFLRTPRKHRFVTQPAYTDLASCDTMPKKRPKSSAGKFNPYNKFTRPQ